MRYIALLRGINVGGHNIIRMSSLKGAFERRGFQDISTYINSGNIIFDSTLDKNCLKIICETLIAEEFKLNIIVCIISAAELASALAHAPKWWNEAPNSKHNAFFVIPPATAEELCARVGVINEKYEIVAHHGLVIFWSAPISSFSRTRWSKIISTDKDVSHAITVRNANTTLKLAELTAKRS